MTDPGADRDVRPGALVLAMFWRGYTTAGAVASMVCGTATTLGLIWLSPTVQIDVLKHSTAWFPLKNPALVTIPLSFAAGIVASLIAARTHEGRGLRPHGAAENTSEPAS
jgi:Na+(H+)/acetate symporter ActP